MQEHVARRKFEVKQRFLLEITQWRVWVVGHGEVDHRRSSTWASQNVLSFRQQKGRIRQIALRPENPGAPSRTRTCNRRIRSPMLYPLSHGRTKRRYYTANPQRHVGLRDVMTKTICFTIKIALNEKCEEPSNQGNRRLSSCRRRILAERVVRFATGNRSREDVGSSVVSQLPIAFSATCHPKMLPAIVV